MMNSKKMSKPAATAAAILFSGALLTACGSGDDFNGTWTGEATTGQADSTSAAATVTVKGKKCNWTLTEADGKANDARCERKDEKFKLADPLTGKDLKYTGTVSDTTLTLTPDSDDAKKIGTLVLTKQGK